MTRTRIGIIGTGWVARARHLPTFTAHPDAEVVAVYDRTLSHAVEAVVDHPGIAAFDDLERFFDTGLDAVSIATPPWSHADLAVTALDRGLHVLTEKPMALELAEAERMVAAADAAGRVLTVSHNFKFSKAVSQAERFIGDAGVDYAIGLQLSSLQRRLPSWYADLPGGLLFDEIPHLVYLLDHFAGPLEVEHVRALGWTGSEPRVVEVLLGGATPGQLTMVFDAPVSEWQVVLTSDAGVVALDLFRDIAVRVGPDGSHGARDILRTSAKAMVDHAAGFVASGARYARGRSFWGHDVLIDGFLGACRGTAANPVPPAEALRIVELTAQVMAGITASRPT